MIGPETHLDRGSLELGLVLSDAEVLAELSVCKERWKERMRERLREGARERD